MTPQWLPQQPWMQMPQGQQGKSTGHGIAEGIGSIGTALIKRGEDEEDEDAPPVNVQAVQTAPAPVDVPMPVAPLPEYGARPVMGAAPEENPLAKRKAAILSTLMGGGMGTYA